MNLNEEKEEALYESLQAYKASLSEKEIEEIVERTHALRAYQESEDSREALETIPLLERGDIEKEAQKLKNQLVKGDKADILVHEVETNGIAYLRYMFDISDMEEEKLLYVGLMKILIGLMNTENYSYTELFNEIHIRTGGMGIVTNFFPDYRDETKYKLTLDVKTKVLYGQLKPAYEIMEEMILKTDFTDKKRLKELLLEVKSKMQSGFVSAGHTLAAGRALSYFSSGSRINEVLKGLEQYRFIEDLLNHFDEKIDGTIEVMQALCRSIFVKERLLVDYTGTKKGFDEVKTISEAFCEVLYEDADVVKEIKPVTCQPKNEAFKTSGQVQFVCRAGNFKEKGLQYTGALKVLRVMMGLSYLLWH